MLWCSVGQEDYYLFKIMSRRYLTDGVTGDVNDLIKPENKKLTAVVSAEARHTPHHHTLASPTPHITTPSHPPPSHRHITTPSTSPPH